MQSLEVALRHGRRESQIVEIELLIFEFLEFGFFAQSYLGFVFTWRAWEAALKFIFEIQNGGVIVARNSLIVNNISFGIFRLRCGIQPLLLLVAAVTTATVCSC